MSEDDELLELAAKAAGAERASFNGSPCGWHIDGAIGTWNPLTSDGDALRLAVKLGIEICPDREIAETSTAFMAGRLGYNTAVSWGPLRDGSKDDPMQATRRAIVEAAAQISRGTK